MEKYATDLSGIDATSDQISTLKKLCVMNGVEFINPINSEEADKMIFSLEMKNNEFNK